MDFENYKYILFNIEKEKFIKMVEKEDFEFKYELGNNIKENYKHCYNIQDDIIIF